MRLPLLLLALVVAVVGCSSQPAKPVGPNVGNAALDAAPGPGPGCPASYAEVHGACESGAVCAYPEGACSCAPGPWCGGAAPPDDRPDEWQCTPTVRHDGCPGQQPEPGSPCATEGQTCDYTCSCLLTAACNNGTWAIEHGPCKP